MLRTFVRRGALAGTALAVGLAGLAVGQGPANASADSAPLAPDHAGTAAFWGPGDTADEFPIPDSTGDHAGQAFAKVVANGYASALALAAGGKVETLGTPVISAMIPSFTGVPTALADETVVDIAGDNAMNESGMAVTDDGDVYTWGPGFLGWEGGASAAADVHDAKAVSIDDSGSSAAIVKQDGSVLAWGSDPDISTPPPLTDADRVFFDSTGDAGYALKSNGTVAAWGNDDHGETDLPGPLINATDGLDVVDIAAVPNGQMALMSDGTLVDWEDSGDADYSYFAPPAALAGKHVVALASSGVNYFAVDSDGELFEWGQNLTGTPDPAFTLPTGIDATNIAQLSANSWFNAAVVTGLGWITKPTIGGTPKVGQALTATPATFTQSPDVTGEWYSGDTATGDTDTSYTPGSTDVGKTITYRSSATKGEQAVTVESSPTSAVVAASTGGDGGGGTTGQQPGTGDTTVPVENPELAHDQAKLHKDKKKLKKAKKAYKKAHGAKKAKLHKKIHKLKKKVKKDKKKVKADK